MSKEVKTETSNRLIQSQRERERGGAVFGDREEGGEGGKVKKETLNAK